MIFSEQYQIYLTAINNELEGILPRTDANTEIIREAMEYSLKSGGKRIRPVLALAVCEVLGGNAKEILPFACAIEMIHTYSLIHDDLPAMDNDDLRRGVPTNHKLFGEAIAILAGDALLNYAFEQMVEHIESINDKFRENIMAMKVISVASGIRGMIGGQVIDIQSENSSVSKDVLQQMHRMKTGELIKAPVLATAYICKAEPEKLERLKKYAENIGMAFQIKDDILDIESSTDILGKPVGSDVQNNKTTFVSLYGLDESKKMLDKLTSEAVEYIEIFGERSMFLSQLALELKNRKK